MWRNIEAYGRLSIPINLILSLFPDAEVQAYGSNFCAELCDGGCPFSVNWTTTKHILQLSGSLDSLTVLIAFLSPI